MTNHDEIDWLVSALMRPTYILNMAKGGEHEDTPYGRSCRARAANARIDIDCLVRSYVEDADLVKHKRGCNYWQDPFICTCGGKRKRALAPELLDAIGAAQVTAQKAHNLAYTTNAPWYVCMGLGKAQNILITYEARYRGRQT